jgi:hypothetical protein
LSAAAITAAAPAPADASFAFVQIGEDPRLYPSAGAAATPKIEDEAGIVHRVPAEAGRGSAAAPQIGLDPSKQVHKTSESLFPICSTLGGIFLLV